MDIFTYITSRVTDGISGHNSPGKPFITLSYAQSLDGSISIDPNASVNLSNRKSHTFTHRLRACHDAILVGIGTVISDDPQLNVRLTEGPDPQPVVVDSQLRFPLSARLLSHHKKKPWIATSSPKDPQKQHVLNRVGVRMERFPALENGWVNLTVLMEYLFRRGIKSVMVEGGARIITSFLRERLADQLVITIAPVIIGGLRGVGDLGYSGNPGFFPIKNVHYQNINGDVIVRGDLIWEQEKK